MRSFASVLGSIASLASGLGSTASLVVSLALAASLALALAGCKDKTALVVEVTSSDLSVPDDIDALRFEAVSDEGPMVDTTVVVTEPFPQSLAIYPGNASTSGDVTITVTGLRADAFVVRRVVRGRFVSGESSYVTVELSGACVGVLCPMGVDCVAGRCTDVVPDAGMPDAGRDAGVVDAGDVDGGVRDDGGVMDGGPRDGGGMDGGPRDGGFDGGSCVPVGLEVCGGGDEDCDGRIDETLPCVGALVLSEIATGGPAGGADEFVEIYNRTSYPVSLTGLGIEYRSATGSSYARRASYPSGASIPAHGYYLVGSAMYSRSPASDLGGGWSTGFAATGGHVRLVSGTTELDRFGWGTATAAEGVAMPAAASDTTETYERKARPGSTAASMESGADATAGNGHDTNDNAADFIVRSTANPQSSSTPPETP